MTPRRTHVSVKEDIGFELEVDEAELNVPLVGGLIRRSGFVGRYCGKFPLQLRVCDHKSLQISIVLDYAVDDPLRDRYRQVCLE